MTRSALNTSIDTVYDNARPDLSLTPSMQGAELKKVADYAEELSQIASQITITTAVSITTDTLAVNGLGQKDRNTIIDNGATNINITVNGGVDFITSYLKHGTGNITFIQGSGRTLVQVSGTNIVSGIQGSTATISSIGTTDYLKIANL